MGQPLTPMQSTRYNDIIQFNIGSNYESYLYDNLSKSVEKISRKTTLWDYSEVEEIYGVKLYFNLKFTYFLHRGTRSTKTGAYSTEYDTSKDTVWLISQFMQNTVYVVPAENREYQVVLTNNRVKLTEIKDQIHTGEFELAFHTPNPITDLSLSTLDDLGFQIGI